MLWDNIIYRFDVDLDIKLNSAVDSICELNLQKDLKQSETHFFRLYKSRAQNNLGSIYTQKGLFEPALESFNQSLAIQKVLKDTSGISSVYKNIGGIYLEKENYPEALDYINQSLTMSKAIGDSSGISGAYESLGIINLINKDFEAALDYFHKSIDLRSAIGQHDYLPTLYINLGSVYEDSGRLDDAKTNYLKGAEFAEQYNDSRTMAAAFKNVGVILTKQGETLEAIKYGELALVHAKTVGSMVLKRDVAKSLYTAYSLEENHESALKMFELYTATKDSINSQENQNAIIRQEYEYAYEKKTAADSIKTLEAMRVQDAKLAKERSQKERAEAVSRRNEIIIYFAIAIVAVILFFVYMVVKSLRLVREQKEKVDEAYDQLEEKNKEILDSINYAKRIQTAILPPDKLVKQYLADSFILYKPKDIVAGDFYWMEPQKDRVLFAAADCTGHGVPGAMVSVVCNNGLNRSVREHGLKDPGQILDKTREIVIAEFEKSEEEVKDGMDIALCSLEQSSLGGNTLKYAGANNPLWIIRKGTSEIEEIKADKQPIGKYADPQPYTTHTIELQKGDAIYIFSDGFADQFGGRKGKKFKAANFKKLLLSIQNMSVEQQKEHIDQAFEDWKDAGGQPIEQLDDVCVIGMRI